MVTRESEKCKNLARRGKWRRPAPPILLCKSKELPAAYMLQLLDYLSEEILPWQKVSKNMFTLIFLEDMENDSRVSFWLLSMNNTNLLNWYILLLRLSRKVSFILEVDVSFDKTVCLMSWGKSVTLHTILSLYQAGEIQKKIHPVIDRSRQVWRNWPLHRWSHRRKGWIVNRAAMWDWEDYIVLCL